MSLSEAPPVAPSAPADTTFPPPTAGQVAAPSAMPAAEVANEQPIVGRTVADDERRGLGRLPRVPFELFLAVLIGAIVLTVVIVVNWSNRSDAEAARTEAEQSLLTAESSATEMAATNADLAVANADLVEANEALEARVETLETDLAAESESLADAQTEVAELRAIPEFDTTPLDDEIAELGDNVTELEAANEALVERAESAEADVAAPAFAQFVGETLASNEGIAVTSDEAECLGRTIISDLGLATVGAGLNAARTDATNGVVAAAVDPALTECTSDSTDGSES